MKKLDSVQILGVTITNAFRDDTLEYILDFLQNSTKKGYIVTPNPEILVYASHHKTFQNILNNAEISLADGVGLIVAGKLLKTQLKNRVTGVEMLENLCFAICDRPITVGFLGGKPGVAEKTAKCLASRYPGLKVVFVAQEWGEEGFLDKNLRLETRNSKLEKKNLSSNFKLQKSNVQHLDSSIKSIDLLFVAFGFPKQEEFMAQNIDKLPVRLMMGVGGAFDYISGRVPRAPKIVRVAGFEWLFRLAIQPWRLKRQLALSEFVLLVLKQVAGH